MNDYEKMGLLIRQAREEKGWTRQNLAEKMGLDEDSVKKTGRRRWKPDGRADRPADVY